MSAWSIYLIRCRDDSLYTGIATDVGRRLKQHESGTAGAKYLRGRGPLRLIVEQVVGDRSLASKIEHRNKKMPRDRKGDLATLPLVIEGLVAELSADQG